MADDEVVLVGYPDSFEAEDGRVVSYHKHLRASRAKRRLVEQKEGWLYCVSSVRNPGPGGKLRARLQDVHTAYVLVCDDVGTKAKVPPAEPSYVLETSPGNYQYGFLLDPLNVSNREGQALFDGCLLALANAGYNDAGCRSASRKVKLPGAIHKSGFVARIVTWAPDVVYGLEELMAEMGVEPVKQRRRGGAMDPDYQGVALGDVMDPVMDWLSTNWTTYGHNDEWVYIECPWRSTHTDAEQGHSSTAYSPRGYGFPGAAFKCMHGHCAGRTTATFLTEINRLRNLRK
jgi:hypothetical protein